MIALFKIFGKDYVTLTGVPACVCVQKEPEYTEIDLRKTEIFTEFQ